MDRKKLPVGYEDIKEIAERNLYFVDKSLMIKELLDGEGKVLLLTRPRRFGKTLNLSMLRRFFEDERTEKGEKIDNRPVFEGLAITKCGEKYLGHQQQYPVISLSLKSAKQPDYHMAYESLLYDIAEEFRRHSYVLEGTKLSSGDKEQFLAVLERKAERAVYARALRILSEDLARYHEKNVVILIDEYDVPLKNAYFMGFYDEMIAFIRSLFESALKTNPNLAFGVVTGCLRISKESIFTGLNNLKVYSVLSAAFSSSFGFTEGEVKELLEYYGISEKYPELKQWYDGYRYGGQEIYNPWSIINYVYDKTVNQENFPRPYWSNTSSNNIIRELIEQADEDTREDLERLMDGETIEKPVHEEVTYGDIHESTDNLWNFLYFTGYLKECGRRSDGETLYISLAIPNTEIRSIYRQSILTWFGKKMKVTDKSPLITALEQGDCTGAENFISAQLLDTISYFDYKESYYHGFLAGLCSGIPGYQTQSNRESGTGRPDIVLREKKFMGRAMILELKVTERFDRMESGCREALAQIEEQNYEAELAADGYRPILKYGLCFFKKGCRIMKA